MDILTCNFFSKAILNSTKTRMPTTTILIIHAAGCNFLDSIFSALFKPAAVASYSPHSWHSQSMHPLYPLHTPPYGCQICDICVLTFCFKSAWDRIDVVRALGIQLWQIVECNQHSSHLSCTLHHSIVCSYRH